jgi:type I restriction enzyme S subunit
MKSYAEMTPANSPWLDEVPAHWDLSRFRYEAVINGGQVDPRKEPWSGMTLIAPNHIERNTGRIISVETADEQGADSGKYLVEQGQLVYSKIRPALNKAAIADTQALCSADMYAMSFTDRVEPRFALYYLLARPFHTFASIISTRVKMPKVNREELADAPWLVPPLDEQRAIADYLDRETARIDTLIEEQQRLIELLRERRNAVVDRALSNDLDAELVQTGDPWLPVLPVGWTAVATKRLLSFGPSNGVSPEAGSVGDLRTLSLGAVRDGRVSMGPDVTKFVDLAAVPRLNDLRLRAGDILLVRGNGNVNLVGRAGLVGPEFDDEEYIYPDLLIRLRVGASMLPEFFVWAFNSAVTRAQIGTRARTAVGTYKVAASDVRAIVLPLPPLSEQAGIVAYLDEQTAKIDSLIAETEKFLEVARERRSALITAAVTGQIDVREMV